MNSGRGCQPKAAVIVMDAFPTQHFEREDKISFQVLYLKLSDFHLTINFSLSLPIPTR